MRIFWWAIIWDTDNLIVYNGTYNRHSCDFAGQESIFAELSVETFRKMSVELFYKKGFL